MLPSQPETLHNVCFTDQAEKMSSLAAREPCLPCVPSACDRVLLPKGLGLDLFAVTYSFQLLADSSAFVRKIVVSPLKFVPQRNNSGC